MQLLPVQCPGLGVTSSPEHAELLLLLRKGCTH